VKDAIEEGGFAGAEVAGKNGDRGSVVGHGRDILRRMIRCKIFANR
jgi:hypothetical protein